MSRHADLERLLQAWYDLEFCAASEKDRYRDLFHCLVDKARAGSNVSRQELILALADRYRDFRTAKDKAIKARLSRLR